MDMRTTRKSPTAKAGASALALKTNQFPILGCSSFVVFRRARCNQRWLGISCIYLKFDDFPSERNLLFYGDFYGDFPAMEPLVSPEINSDNIRKGSHLCCQVLKELSLRSLEGVPRQAAAGSARSQQLFCV